MSRNQDDVADADTVSLPRFPPHYARATTRRFMAMKENDGHDAIHRAMTANSHRNAGKTTNNYSMRSTKLFLSSRPRKAGGTPTSPPPSKRYAPKETCCATHVMPMENTACAFLGHMV